MMTTWDKAQGRSLTALTTTLVLALLAVVLLSGCGTGQPGGQTSSSSGPAPVSTATTASPTPASAMTPAAPKSGVMLHWEGPAQVELIASGSPRVLIDVWSPSMLSAPATADDILLTTHTHEDHMSYEFTESFPGTQLFVREGRIEKPGVAIRGIAAAHTQGDPLVPEGGTDYIFIIDIDGLRIVHFGDLGQTRLTPEQMKALGHVDIAITQFENSFSQMDVTNKKGFRQMAQVKPRLIIQTHSSLAAVKYAATLWPVLYSKRTSVTLTATRLPQKTSLLLLGEEGALYTESVPARKVHW